MAITMAATCLKSTLAAETLAQVDASETCFWLSTILNEILGNTNGNASRNIECRTDNHSLYDAFYSITSLTDKRLAIVREMLCKGELEKVIWIPKENQLADCLTKAGSSSFRLLDVLEKRMI